MEIHCNIELLQLNGHSFFKDWLSQRIRIPLIIHKIKDGTAKRPETNQINKKTLCWVFPGVARVASVCSTKGPRAEFLPFSVHYRPLRSISIE